MSEAPSHPRPSASKSALFAGVSLIGLLLLVEGAWRALALAGLVLPPTGDRDLREEWLWVTRHLESGKNPLNIAQAQFDPELGWIPLPNSSRPGATVNRLGQRGSEVVPVERTDRSPRVLLVGDSYTFGAQVNDEETYSSLLAKRYLPEGEVINLGISGYGPDQAILFYEREGVKYKPDIVVLGFFVHGISRCAAGFKYYAKPRFELVGEEVQPSGARIPSPTELLAEYRAGSRKIAPRYPYLAEEFLDLFRKATTRKIDETSSVWKITEGMLDRFRERAEAEGTHPFLLIIPYSEILEEKESRSTVVAGLLVNKARASGLACLDLGPIFREKAPREKGPLYNGHWTARGHEIAAEALHQSLLEAGFLKSKGTPATPRVAQP
ncbi:MAG: SGNH/GDSL hydrolase family protein [Candidatus Omnitrophica bacterium]|nr:hypothetical protein [bacterium]NUN95543.1 SGNH/GDSL hydrolase family protein [Candidatus Omnitrophota bacterium]